MSYCPACGAENPRDAAYCESCGSSLRPATEEFTKPDHGKCSYCAKPFVGDDAYYFRCRYCGKDFCYEHRLPENHLCKSSPIRRNIPSTAAPYYASSGGGYYTSSSSGRGGFGFRLSKQGRNLVIAIVAGLPIGFLLSLISLSNGLNLAFYFTQYNAFVYGGWLPPLLTSMIVVYPGIPGLEDVFFNAIFVIFVDRLLAATYSPKQYYAVFIIAGLAGNLLSLLGGPNILSFGASGGLFGLIAGAVALDYAIYRRVNTNLLVWFLIVFIFSSIAVGVNVLAHLGGAVVGLIAGYVIGTSRRGRGRVF